MQMYMEAEAAFRQVLKMDPKCDDAVLELHRLHLLHLTVLSSVYVSYYVQYFAAALNRIDHVHVWDVVTLRQSSSALFTFHDICMHNF